MDATTNVSVPGGRWFDGVRHQDVELRPLPARDEVRLADPEDRAAGRSTASRLTWLLSRCVVRLGPHREVDEDLLRDLTVGDREAIALHLRRLLFGERMAGVVSCPGCGDPLDLELTVEQLLVPAYPDARSFYLAGIDDGDVRFEVRFRLPTGRDQEEAGSIAAGGSVLPEAEILRRCVLEIAGGDASPGDALPEAVTAQLPSAMARLDPQALLNLEMRCPACEAAFVVPFSPSAFLVREVFDRSKRLLAEVHALAMSYHWTESAILALPHRRRRAYLELLDRSQVLGTLA